MVDPEQRRMGLAVYLSDIERGRNATRVPALYFVGSVVIHSNDFASFS
jgi:hypothetical protein